MFNFLKKKEEGIKSVIKIDGMHCVSCSLSVDDALEEIKGVFSAKTSYAKGEVVVSWDPTKTNEKTMMKTIKDLGYVPSLNK